MKQKLEAPAPAADETDARAVTLWSVGPYAAAALQGSKVRWVCDLGDGSNVWAADLDLPRGVNRNNVRALHAWCEGVTLMTEREVHVWMQVARKWRRLASPLAPPPNARR